jgi:hypothetical protein
MFTCTQKRSWHVVETWKILMKKINNYVGSIAQVIESLPNKLKALSSNPYAAKKEKIDD